MSRYLGIFRSEESLEKYLEKKNTKKEESKITYQNLKTKAKFVYKKGRSKRFGKRGRQWKIIL